MLTIKTNRGPPSKGMLREAYVDGVVTGLEANATVAKTARELATFTLSQIFSGKDQEKALEALNKAYEWASTQSERNLGDIQPDELEAARARRVEMAAPRRKP